MRNSTYFQHQILWARCVSFAFILLFGSFVHAQDDKIHFQQFSVKDGLPQSRVTDIAEDHEGFIWVATRNTVSRFDGTTFRDFSGSGVDSLSLPKLRITSLAVDNDDHIWVGTAGRGVFRYNKRTGRFLQFPQAEGDKIENAIWHENINGMDYDAKRNALWLVTVYGLTKLDLNTYQHTVYDLVYFKQKKKSPNLKARSLSEVHVASNGAVWVAKDRVVYQFFPEEERLLCLDKLHNFGSPTCMAEDKNGKVWAGTTKGLFSFQHQNNRLDHEAYRHDSALFAGNRVQSIACSKQGKLLIGVENRGLIILDTESGKYKQYQADDTDEYSISHNSIFAIYLDSNEKVWIGTYNQGLNLWDKNWVKFDVHRKRLGENALSHQIISCFEEDELGRVWIGTDGGGFNLWQPETDTYETFSTQTHPAMPSDAILDLQSDKHNNLWIASWRGGLTYFDTQKRSFTPYGGLQQGGLPKHVFRLFPDGDRGMWLVTFDQGLCYFDFEKRTVTSLVWLSDSNRMTIKMANSGCKATNGEIWVGTVAGLNRFIPTPDGSFQIKNYKRNDNIPGSLKLDFINDVFEDSRQNIYVATAGGGLSRYLPESDSFETVLKEDGLPSNEIASVEEDSSGVLWLSTGNGICSYRPETKEIHCFDEADGLQGRIFFRSASIHLERGTLLFGGTKGFNSFRPEAISPNPLLPKLFFSELKLFNKKVRPSADHPILQQPLKYTQHITLTHKESVFSIGYYAISITQAHKTEYAYKLAGLENEWNYVGNINSATYTNLEPGEYTFEVKAANNDGLWQEEAISLTITVLPPWWETWWFRSVMLLFIAGSAISFYFWRITQIKAQKAELERLVEIRTAEVVARNKEIEQQKEEIQSQADRLLEANVELEKLSIVASQTSNMVMITDNTGQIEWVNHAFEKSYGYNLNELNEHFGGTLLGFARNKEVKTLLPICLSERISVNFDTEIETKEGDTRWTQTTLTPVVDNSGEVNKLVAIDTDISEIKKAEAKIIKQNELINSSIQYARTIQQAVLPKFAAFGKTFDFFMLFRPRDVVSGDFYWVSQRETSNGRKFWFVAVVDCTGHGVPGAFMSMIGIRLLNLLINERGMIEPGEVLTEMEKEVQATLQQNETNNRDGMDMILCRFENVNKAWEVQYAGAKRPLLYVENDSPGLNIINATRSSIGGIKRRKTELTFAQHSLSLKPKTQLYLTTDGIIDQNNEAREKFGSPAFYSLLQAVSKSEGQQQKKRIEEELDAHMGEAEQRDDITVMGIRLA